VRYVKNCLEQESVGCTVADFDARRLERGSIQRHVEDFSVGGALLYIPDDVWKLRPIQPPRRYSCRRFLVRCKFAETIHRMF